ncbi:single-stranded-DNA-specific exonuclease RecJ [uncultured Sneathiella sp.]|jgi:single-stranded-DNA-specific exonuclease|uniref:single-stranded-DNA-specific exonuclease RecJ n=1 Tax=uncultured Sneathiella sp. TaxID=879315 RepID=UPI0030DC26CB|tara:strand:+ start:7255 stop:9042 length:1788 start_codon:yes stop_codon:yes gene_type:complete
MDAPVVPAFLDVESSLKGKRWRLRSENERLGLAISQRLDVPEIVGRVMAGRGVALEEAEQYLDPTLRNLLPDPSSFKDMDKGAARIAAAIEGAEKIAVFGDYDVDGATSSGLLKRFFNAIGAPVIIYIPDRMKEGYGPNSAAMDTLKSQGVDLVITVDCGIVSFDVLKHAKDIGLEVIVVDHHQAETRLPDAVAVINPKRHDESQQFTYLAAVGVTFLLVVAVNRTLREAGWYNDTRREPDPRYWLDLVALGTVCDVVPLIGLNRAFVARGLKVMARRGNAGLAALADVAGLDEAPGTYHAGFLLGPRVNAGGRVGRPEYGPELLSLDDPVQCRKLAQFLDGYNQDRKAIEAEVQDEALNMVENSPLKDDAVIVVAGEGWHPGVIGIVASRLKDAFQRPAIVIALDGAAGKGSGRSVPGVDMGAAIGAARHKEIITAGGGHMMAAGLSIAADRIDDFRTFLNDRLKGAVSEASKTASLGLDGALSVAGATTELITLLEQAGPYGAGNPEPRFALQNVRLVQASIVGENHVRCILTSVAGQGRLAGICFRALETPLGDALLGHQGASFHIAGHLRKNSWQGKVSAQLMIEDAVRLT